MKTITLTRQALNRGSLLLVNASHPLPESVAPERLTPFFGSGVLLERRTSLVLENLFETLGLGASLILSLIHISVRGAVYTGAIFLTEFITGSFLKRRGMCPWDYSRARFNIHGVIRLDYAPVWFLTGLLYERILYLSLIHI